MSPKTTSDIHLSPQQTRPHTLYGCPPQAPEGELRPRTAYVAVSMLLSQLGLASGQGHPLIDHHQHLVSPAAATRSPALGVITATDLVAALDLAGIRRAVVLSVAYQFSNPNAPGIANEYASVKAENDWTSRQVARFPDRLRGFCSVNPLKEYALDEIARCARDANLHWGLKLHFGNSDVDLDNPKQVAQLRRVFAAADEHQMALVVHMHPSFTMRRPYGAKEARVFLTELLPAARSVPVQIAHLAGGGGYDEPMTDEALGVFVDAIAAKDPRMAHVYFDISGVAGNGEWVERANLIASRIRQIGVERILYGSDAMSGNATPKNMVAAFRRLPLSDAEFRVIEKNVAPYMR